MTCKYCGSGVKVERKDAMICSAKACQNQGKSDRAFFRRTGAERSRPYAPRIEKTDPLYDPTELEYLDSDPGITIEQLANLQHDPLARRKVHESRHLRQGKLVQRIREVGLYDLPPRPFF